MGGQDDMQPAEVSSIKLTYDDYLLFPDDGRRHELIDGEHYVTPAPSLWHQEISKRLFLALTDCLRVRPLGQVFYAPVDVTRLARRCCRVSPSPSRICFAEAHANPTG